MKNKTQIPFYCNREITTIRFQKEKRRIYPETRSVQPIASVVSTSKVAGSINENGKLQANQEFRKKLKWETGQGYIKRLGNI